jgi:hypothetical protein
MTPNSSLRSPPFSVSGCLINRVYVLGSVSVSGPAIPCHKSSPQLWPVARASCHGYHICLKLIAEPKGRGWPIFDTVSLMSCPPHVLTLLFGQLLELVQGCCFHWMARAVQVKQNRKTEVHENRSTFFARP